ncbi:MAG: CoA transferase subunit A [Chloroflexi bacterium]|nr:CoA transferase subunit A [Chloroflexota bacterium]
MTVPDQREAVDPESLRPRRRSKVVDLATAVQMVRPGTSVCIGGFLYHNRPAAFVRELIRRRIGDLTLFSSPSSSYEADLLLGSGLVKKAYLANVVFEYMGLAPNYRKAWETGSVEMVECEEATIIGGFMATVEGLAYHPVQSLKGTEVLKVSELCKKFMSIDGVEMLAVPALKPDVAVLHAQQADEYGNIRYLGASFADILIAKASGKVIVTVDEIVSTSTVQNEPWRTTIPGYIVEAVVEVPYGAHPSSSHCRYVHDEDHLRAYIAAAEESRREPDSGKYEEYVRKFVDEPADHFDYLDRVGGLARLTGLKKDW